ncbi:MarR family winged helix-turn-helix transcriptional regulator [Leucobacter japonicus]|uniref:MarR family winged helix-turn-helix transcriptional regulator n=1 Tax=Leucobacter japonicus TaxID=1461259 RepID=UPI0006A7CDC4|nr:MarR family transcriptional regulator [Leucobacter japonicus]
MNELIGAKQQLLLSRIAADGQGRLVMLVLTTARRIDEACAQLLEQYGLSEGRLAVLLAIESGQHVTPRDLARQLEVTPATITGLVEHLVTGALVERQSHASDRRTHLLSLTASGTRLLAALTPLYAEWMQQLESGLSEADFEAAEDVLARMQHNTVAVPGDE